MVARKLMKPSQCFGQDMTLGAASHSKPYASTVPCLVVWPCRPMNLLPRALDRFSGCRALGTLGGEAKRQACSASAPLPHQSFRVRHG